MLNRRLKWSDWSGWSRSAVVGGVLAAVVLVTGLAAPLAPVASAAGAPPPHIRGAGARSAIADSYLVMLKDSPTLRGNGLATKAKALAAAHHGKLVGEVWTALHGFAAHMSAADAEQLAADPAVAYVEQDHLMVGPGGPRLRQGGLMGPIGGSTGRAATSVVAPTAGQRSPAQRGQLAPVSPVVTNHDSPETSGLSVVPAVPAAAQSSASWGLDRIDQHALPLDGKYAYDDAAGQGSTIYIIGTGIQPENADFGGRASLGPNFVTDDGQADSYDCLGSGTEMAGIVGGTQYGVAKKAHLVGIRIFRCTNGIGEFSWLIAAFNWVISNAQKPAVVDLALADQCADQQTGQSVPCDPNDATSAINAQEVAYSEGVLVVANAGDSGIDNSTRSVGAAPDDFYVGASTTSDTRASFSNYGSLLTMFAPGENVTTDSLSGGSITDSGTVLAASYVAGTVALFLSKPEFAGVSPAKLKDELVKNRATNDKLNGASLGAGSPNRLLFTGPPGFFTVDDSVNDSLSLAPSNGSPSGGPVQLVGANKQGNVLRRLQNPDGSWGPWAQTETKGWQGAAVGMNANGATELVGLTPVGDLWPRVETDANTNQWFAWHELDRPAGTQALSHLALASNSDGRLVMFATTTAGKLLFRTQPTANAKTWAIWHDFAQPFAGKLGSITAGVNANQQIVVLGVDEAGRVWQSRQQTAGDTASFGAFQTLGDFGVVSIAAARNFDGRLELLGVDAGGNPWRRAQTAQGSDSWTTWSALPPRTLANVGAVLGINGQVLVIGVDNLGNIWQSQQFAQNSPNYGFWNPIDGQLRP